MTAMNKLTTTYETTREFDEKGNVTPRDSYGDERRA